MGGHEAPFERTKGLLPLAKRPQRKVDCGWREGKYTKEKPAYLKPLNPDNETNFWPFVFGFY